jgi:hypothetical protein
MWDTDPSAVLFHKISEIFFFNCSVESLAVVLSAILLVYCASIGRLCFSPPLSKLLRHVLLFLLL